MHMPKLSTHLLGVALLVAAGVAWLAFTGQGELNRPQRLTLAFERGTLLPGAEQARLRVVQAAMRENPAYGAVIKGHSGTLGDPAANLALSEQRASAVARALADLGIDPERLTAIGVGGEEPLPRRDGEGDLSYQKRLGRADVLLRVP